MLIRSSLLMLSIFLWIAPQPVGRAGEKEAPLPKTENKIKFPLPRPSEIGAEKFSLLLNTFLQQEGYEVWKKDMRLRTTGPFFVKPSGLVQNFGTHGPAAVKVYYSPEVWDWMQNGRKGAIVDGGIILKLLYARDAADPSKFSAEPTGFSVMVKDSKGSWDGWFYSDGGPLTVPVPEHGSTYFDPNAGFGLSCMNCHASADNPESTYSSPRNVLGEPSHDFKTTLSAEGLKKMFVPADIHTQQNVEAVAARIMRDPAPWWNSSKAAARTEPAPLPFATYDHLPQGPRPNGQRAFVTSSNCSACHDAVQLYSAQPNMTLSETLKSGETALLNLSPHSEWRYSMLGLSGRDPVFFAQLESERELHPELADEIDNTCLSCHAVMGQRQWKRDQGADALFSHKIVNAAPGSEHGQYGALARDGVSCVVCHQMQPDGLGTAKTFTGKFAEQEKATQIYGPYEKVVTLPMEQSLGLTPKLSAHISDSKLCATCHTVALPVLERGRKYGRAEFDRMMSDETPKTFHEQATYLEWKNSAYSTEGANHAARQSCQDCHMPRTHKNQRLVFKVANIEDDSFPPVDNRAPDAQLRVADRESFGRHTLNGINLFVLEMFDQNPWLLGIPRRNNLMPDARAKSGFEVAKSAALEMAREQTAFVQILSAKRERGKLVAQVQVSNLTGHKFPTGVSFRRAFIELKVKAGEKTIWASGTTDNWGVIGANGKDGFAALKSEFFTDGAHQLHHQKITREDQVQIYEELVAGSDGALTTSFLNLKTVMKDNRLLPKGWKAGPEAEAIHPAGTGDDPDYQNEAGKDVVMYEIPIDAAEGQPLTVSATLFYQTLPPYYLRQRFEHIDKPATQRLYYLVNQLDLSKSGVPDWKLKIGADSINVE